MAAPGETPAFLLPYKLDRASAFACIAMFDSGLYDSDRDEQDNAMAMSSGDSICASVALLCGPSEDSRSHPWFSRRRSFAFARAIGFRVSRPSRMTGKRLYEHTRSCERRARMSYSRENVSRTGAFRA